MTNLTTCTTSTFTRVEFSIEVGSVSRLVLLPSQSPLLILFDLFDGLQETIDQLYCTKAHPWVDLRDTLEFVLFGITTWLEHFWVSHEVQDLPFLNSLEVTLDDRGISDYLELFLPFHLLYQHELQEPVWIDVRYA
jgi:hypothetical protein